MAKPVEDSRDALTNTRKPLHEAQGATEILEAIAKRANGIASALGRDDADVGKGDNDLGVLADQIRQLDPAADATDKANRALHDGDATIAERVSPHIEAIRGQLTYAISELTTARAELARDDTVAQAVARLKSLARKTGTASRTFNDSMARAVTDVAHREDLLTGILTRHAR